MPEAGHKTYGVNQLRTSLSDPGLLSSQPLFAINPSIIMYYGSVIAMVYGLLDWTVLPGQGRTERLPLLQSDQLIASTTDPVLS